MSLTFEEFSSIPRAEDLPAGFLKACRFGFRFKCAGSKDATNTVIGVVVRGLDALVDQWGAGLSIPERFVNRYRAQVTTPLLDYQI